MSRNDHINQHPIRLGLLALLALLLASPIALASSRTSWAITDEIEAKITEAQKQIENSAAAYEAAETRIAELTAQVEENGERIVQLETELPVQRERSDQAMVALYKMQREGYSLIDMVLSSENIIDFLNCVDYLSRTQEQNLETVRQLTAMEEELTDTREALDKALKEAEEQSRRAERSLAIAQEAREQAQREAQEQARKEREAQEAARKAAEAAAAEAAAAKEKPSSSEDEKNDSDESGKSDSSAAESEQPPSSSPSNDGANWGSDKQAFVNQWAGRIDGYLAGSALAGQGETFASAAWDYGVDPRWSPAISAVESSKGGSCFRSHNAWGWGSSSWGSWDEAIRAHVAGLARTYGYTLTENAAKKYCPSSWQHWYSRCADEMNAI